MHGGTAAGPVTLRTPCTPRTLCTHPLHSQIIKEGASRGCELSYETPLYLRRLISRREASTKYISIQFNDFQTW